MFQKITRQNLDRFLKKHASAKRTLDLGSGGSSYSRHFPNRLTVDIDPARGPDVVADAHNLPFKNNEFEMVLCTEMLEHVQNTQQVIDEIKRVLRPGGKVILTTRFVFPIHDAPNDYWRFTKYGLEYLFRDWKIVALESETETLSALAVLFQRLGYQVKFHLNKPVKLVFFSLATILNRLNWLVSKEFGDIGQSRIEKNIITSGYYLVAEKNH